MKKEYLEPSMRVCELKLSHILMGSGEQRSPKKYDDEFGYIPGLLEDEKKLV